MKKFAIWKDKQVIGYIELTEEQKNELNKIKDIGVYFGFDRTTNPEKYCKHINDNFQCTDKECNQCPINLMQ